MAWLAAARIWDSDKQDATCGCVPRVDVPYGPVSSRGIGQTNLTSHDCQSLTEQEPGAESRCRGGVNATGCFKETCFSLILHNCCRSCGLVDWWTDCCFYSGAHESERYAPSTRLENRCCGLVFEMGPRGSTGHYCDLFESSAMQLVQSL